MFKVSLLLTIIMYCLDFSQATDTNDNQIKRYNTPFRWGKRNQNEQHATYLNELCKRIIYKYKVYQQLNGKMNPKRTIQDEDLSFLAGLTQQDSSLFRLCLKYTQLKDTVNAINYKNKDYADKRLNSPFKWGKRNGDELDEDDDSVELSDSFEIDD